MENIILKDVTALIEIFTDKYNDVAVFRILSSKIFSVKKTDLYTFTKEISNLNWKQRNDAKRNGHKQISTYHLINGFDKMHGLPIDNHLFMFIKNKIDGILLQKNILSLIEDIFADFGLIEQSEILECKKEILKFKDSLINYIKKEEKTGLLMIGDVKEFVEKEYFDIKDKKTAEEKIILDIDYLILRAKLRTDDKDKEKWEKKKEKIINKSEDLDAAYYVEQIKENKYANEKELQKMPVFSASQFSLYETCPLQYKYSYIYSIPIPPKYYFTFGSVMHSVIEEITKRIKEHSNVDNNFAKLMYESLWEKEGYKSKEQEEEYKKQGYKIIEEFLKKQKEVRH